VTPAAPVAFEEEVVDQAIAWLVLLWSGEADAAALAEWRRWRAAHPEHERAWQRIEARDGRLAQRLAALPAPLSAATALAALNRGGMGRRRALKTLSLVAAVGGMGMAGQQVLPWREWAADARTARGERRTLQLPDGSEVLLNTASAIDIRYHAYERRVLLRGGEVFVTAIADTQPRARPFLVETAAGDIRGFETRFAVRQQDNAARVSVLEGAVELLAPLGTARVAAGETALFSAAAAPVVSALDGQAAWVDGTLVATDMRLGDFLAELQRYHSAHLSCDPTIADLRLSGVFPLENPERVLQSLGKALPVELHHFTRYWVRVVPLA
jgi:transmembrane sensor